MTLSQAFEVFDKIVGAGLEGSVHARRSSDVEMDFTVGLSLVDRTQEQLGTLAGIVERYELQLDVDEHRNASLK